MNYQWKKQKKGEGEYKKTIVNSHEHGALPAV